jgi:DNA-binding FrmR family transcriptional regulator
MSMQVDKQDVLKRIHYIEGHLGGIGRMIEEDATCIDVLRQTYAVRKAIEKLEALLVENHLASSKQSTLTNPTARAMSTSTRESEEKPNRSRNRGTYSTGPSC